MRKFPSIEQFRHAVKNVIHKATYIGQSAEDTPVYDNSLPKPVLVFKGTTKLHGTNGGVEFDLKSKSFEAVSHYRVLTLDDDNHGFCAWVMSTSGMASLTRWTDAMRRIWTGPAAKSFHIFGEWVGSTVNTKTAVGRLPTRFVAFAALVADEDGSEHWLDIDTVAKAYYEDGSTRVADFCFISEFQQWEISIDFQDPSAVLEKLEALTLEVEASCPVAQALGGDEGGLGEGIVWVSHHPEFGRIVFKTKGEKHVGTRGASRVSLAPEVLASREAFVDAVLTDSRLEQGLEFMKAKYGAVTLDQMGEFLKWVGQDVLKEESDTLEASGLDRKDVMGQLNRRAKAWVTPHLDLLPV
jgi:hypothetical protein